MCSHFPAHTNVNDKSLEQRASRDWINRPNMKQMRWMWNATKPERWTQNKALKRNVMNIQWQIMKFYAKEKRSQQTAMYSEFVLRFELFVLCFFFVSFFFFIFLLILSFAFSFARLFSRSARTNPNCNMPSLFLPGADAIVVVIAAALCHSAI